MGLSVIYTKIDIIVLTEYSEHSFAWDYWYWKEKESEVRRGLKRIILHPPLNFGINCSKMTKTFSSICRSTKPLLSIRWLFQNPRIGSSHFCYHQRIRGSFALILVKSASLLLLDYLGLWWSRAMSETDKTLRYW